MFNEAMSVRGQSVNKEQRRRTAQAAKRSRYHAALSDELRRDLDSAIAFYRTRRFSEAEAACQRVLSAQPTHPGTLSLLGTVLAAAGRLDEAIAVFLFAQKEFRSRSDALTDHANRYPA